MMGFTKKYNIKIYGHKIIINGEKYPIENISKIDIIEKEKSAPIRTILSLSLIIGLITIFIKSCDHNTSNIVLIKSFTIPFFISCLRLLSYFY